MQPLGVLYQLLLLCHHRSDSLGHVLVLFCLRCEVGAVGRAVRNGQCCVEMPVIGEVGGRHGQCIVSRGHRTHRLKIVSSETVDPLFHSCVVALIWVPSFVVVTRSARLNHDEGGEAVNTVPRSRVGVLSAVHLDEHNLVTVLRRKLLHDLVPVVQKFDTVPAPWHEKVYDNVGVAWCRINQVLELDCVVGLCSEGVLPPIVSTHFSVFCFCWLLAGAKGGGVVYLVLFLNYCLYNLFSVIIWSGF